MEEKCGSAAICFVSFLPDILDSKAEGRNKYLEMLLSVAEKFKRSPYRQVLKLSLDFSIARARICFETEVESLLIITSVLQLCLDSCW